MTKVGPWSTQWNRKNRYNVPTIPRLGGFADSGANRLFDPSNYPQIFLTRLSFKGLGSASRQHDSVWHEILFKMFRNG